MTRSSPALRGIEHIDDNWLQDALRAAPSYNMRVANAIGRIVRCIHGLGDLHRTVRLDELEVYLGRSTAASLKQRLRQHSRTHRGHNYALVLFTCDPSRIESLERVGVTILTKLNARGVLCVGRANRWNSAGGAPPRPGETALVYMTWRITAPIEHERPSITDVRDIAHEVHRETNGAYTAQTVETGLRHIKRRSAADPLHWWAP
jgi:hypothetical protein